MSNSPASDCSNLSDGELLARFAHTGDEAAFRTMVERHGPLVLGVCRRGAPSVADADDAFQATFLVLAQSADKIRRRTSLAAWLYGVACRTCARLRRDQVRRPAQQLVEPVVTYNDPLDELLARHDELVTDEELAALPEALRTPLILRYLAGKENADVARELGITVAALEGRLKRAKQKLRMRLIRRGVTLAAAVAVLRASRIAEAGVPKALVESTVSLGVSPSTELSTTVYDHPTPLQLAQQEIQVMNTALLSKPVVAMCAAATVVVTLAIGVPLAVSQGTASSGAPSSATLKAAPTGNIDADSPATRFVQAGAYEPIAPTNRRRPSSHTFGGQPTVEGNATYGKEGETGYSSSFAGTGEGSIGAESEASPPTFESNTSTRVFDLAARTPSELKIRRTLAKPLHDSGLDFVDSPLEGAVDFLQSEYSIPILLDAPALDDVGLASDEPVTIQVREITFQSALRLMLRQLDLTYMIENEVLMITTPEVAATNLSTRVYATEDLNAHPEKLVDLVMATVASDTWAENGGGEAEIMTVPGGIVVSQTYAVHELIHDLLRQLAQQQERSSRR